MVPIDRKRAAAEFLKLLVGAGRLVADRWFLLQTASGRGNEPVVRYRERVYCYELYHQLRTLSDNPHGRDAGAPAYTLSGEIDKAQLNAVIDGGRHKPDLVWHVPGQWQHNAVVIEVKAADHLKLDPLRKDLQTLSAFLRAERGYERAALLIYGGAEGEFLRRRVLQAAADVGFPSDLAQRAHLLWHPRPRQAMQDLGPLVQCV
ncbi:hypothetical protein [Micromonospora profundi]|uniref:hypothetical protein n=1 Tax=Micromonospora profundi TaxID=1420889 RepID=UPI0036497DDB